LDALKEFKMLDKDKKLSDAINGIIMGLNRKTTKRRFDPHHG